MSTGSSSTHDNAVLSTSTTSSLALSLHPLPILNISEHLTRLKLQTNNSSPFIIGALLGTQSGRDVEIVNTFELATNAAPGSDTPTDSAAGQPLQLNVPFLIERRDQYKQVFPSLELLGWYTAGRVPTNLHLTLHSQFLEFTSTPLLVILTPCSCTNPKLQSLPIKAYEPTIEAHEHKSRNVYVEVPLKIETGEAERIAVDWTARDGAGGGSLASNLQTQRAAIQMLHSRIAVLVKYVTSVLAGELPKDYATLRSLSALIASLPASENKGFREEFDTERADVQLTAFLATLTKSANMLNDLVDKNLILTAGEREGGGPRGGRRRMIPGASFHGAFGGGGPGRWGDRVMG